MLKSIDASTTRSSNFVKPLYLLLAIAGSIAPWFWLLQEPTALLAPTVFFQRAFANTIATALATDLLICCIAFFCFAWIELKRLHVSHLWIIVYIGLTFGVGLSCSLPFFLYRREQILERNYRSSVTLARAKSGSLTKSDFQHRGLRHGFLSVCDRYIVHGVGVSSGSCYFSFPGVTQERYSCRHKA